MKFFFVLFILSVVGIHAGEEKTMMNQMGISHIGPGGIGYSDGYTTVNLLLASKNYHKGYFFTDFRFHEFDNGKFASNLGFGARWTPKNRIGTCGINLFYDNRQLHHLFHQVGCGLELQKHRLFLNANGYFTLGSKNQVVEKIGYNYDDDQYIRQVFSTETLVNHWDAEIGFFILMKPLQKFYIGIGPYMLSSQTLTTTSIQYWGGKGHLHLILHRLLHIELFISHDSLFKTKCQGQISLTIPLSTLRHSSWSFMPVIRQEIIPLENINYWKWNY